MLQDIPEEILVIATSSRSNTSSIEPRRGSISARLLNRHSVNLSDLQQQVNIFLQQVNVMMADAPEKVGGFQLAEFEVSAGITLEGKGEVKLALLASGEIGGGINAGLKFLFRRS
jgi:hypothetical protein